MICRLCNRKGIRMVYQVWIERKITEVCGDCQEKHNLPTVAAKGIRAGCPIFFKSHHPARPDINVATERFLSITKNETNKITRKI